MDSIGKRVKEARLSKKMTQSEVAGDFITRNMLSKIENDVAMPSIKTVEYLASVLDRKVSYFLDACSDGYSENKDLLYEDTNQRPIINKEIIKKLLINKDYEGIINELENVEIDKYIDMGILLQKAYIERAKKAPKEAKKLYEKANELCNKLLYVPNDNKISINIGLMKYNISSLEYDKIKNELLHDLFKSNKISIYNIIRAEEYMNSRNISDGKESNFKTLNIAKVILEDVNVDLLDEYWKGKYYYLMAIINEDSHDVYQSMLHKCEKNWSKLGKIELMLDVYNRLCDYFSNNENYEKAYYYSIKEKDLLRIV